MALKPPFSSLYYCYDVLRLLAVSPPPRSFPPMGIGEWHRRCLNLATPHLGDAHTWQRLILATPTPGDASSWRCPHLATPHLGDASPWRRLKRSTCWLSSLGPPWGVPPYVDFDFGQRPRTGRYKVKMQIQQQIEKYAKYNNKGKREIIFEEGDLVWLHLRKDRFPTKRESKLSPRGDGPFQILKKVNNNAYKLDLPVEYGVHDTFNVIDLSPFVGTNEENDDLDLRTNSFQGGGDDGRGPSTNPKEGQAPIQRRAKHQDILGQLQGPWLRGLMRIGTLLLMAEKLTSTCSKRSKSKRSIVFKFLSK